MSLPINRSAKATLDLNLVNGNTSDAPAIKASDDVLYNTIDELYNYALSLVTSGTLSPLPPDFMFRQAFSNALFDVWELGTSFTMSTGARYTADRWSHTIDSITSGSITINKNTADAPIDQKYCYEIDYASGVGVSDRLEQSFEAIDVAKFRGKQIIVSVEAKVSSGTLPVNLAIVDGTNADGYPVTSTTQDVTSATLSTAYQTFTITHTVQSGANSLVARLVSGVKAGFTGKIFVGKVQLCTGNVALPVQPRSFPDELRLCQRYRKRFNNDSGFSRIGFGLAISTTSASIAVVLPEKMRISPNLIISAAADFELSDGVSAVAVTSITLSGITTSTNMALLTVGVAAGLTQYRPYFLEFSGV